MLKKTCILILVLALSLSFATLASASNRDMQLMGSMVVTNSTDAFFFSPMEEGLTSHWGLYRLSTAADGPLREIENGYPARLLHADDEYVYFLSYENTDRTLHALRAVKISDGSAEELQGGIAKAFVEESETFFYVSDSDPYTLRRYSIPDRKSTEVKNMSGSEKTIYDAGTYGGTVYFLTRAKDGVTEDGYQLHSSSGKATNLDSPSVKVDHGLLYEGYRLYAGDKNGSQIYSVKIGSKTANELGKRVTVSLTSFRFGEYIYAYDGDDHQLVGQALDGSGEVVMPLDGSGLSRMVMGGTKEEVLIYVDNAIYSMPPNLTSKSKVIDFDLSAGGQLWCYAIPMGSDAIAMMGYNAESFTHAGNMLPTGVYIYSRSTGEELFAYPPYDAENPPEQTMPETLGTPVQEGEEGEETPFMF